MKASWTTSSARPRRPHMRYASENAGPEWRANTTSNARACPSRTSAMRSSSARSRRSPWRMRGRALNTASILTRAFGARITPARRSRHAPSRSAYALRACGEATREVARAHNRLSRAGAGHAGAAPAAQRCTANIEEEAMANVLCVLYDDPVDGYPPAYARDEIPHIERYYDGQTTPTPEGIDFTPGELLGSVSGELGLRSFLERRGHSLLVTADKDGLDSVFEREL